MSWQEMQQLAAVLVLDTLVAAHRDGADALLRDRVAALDDNIRHALRDALAAAAA
jgi:hypothetical protein